MFSIDHIGVAVKSLAAAKAIYEKLGLSVSSEELVEAEQVRVVMVPVGESRLELLEPTSENSVIAKFIAKRGEGLHHVSLRVPNLKAVVERLKTLRGKPHQLHSAVVAAQGGAVVWRETQSATLKMRDFSDAFLEDYLASEGEAALGSVGCYRLEGMGLQLFSRIEGDYFTILGLPMMGLMDLLRRRGVLAS